MMTPAIDRRGSRGWCTSTPFCANFFKKSPILAEKCKKIFNHVPVFLNGWVKSGWTIIKKSQDIFFICTCLFAYQLLTHINKTGTILSVETGVQG